MVSMPLPFTFLAVRHVLLLSLFMALVSWNSHAIVTDVRWFAPSSVPRMQCTSPWCAQACRTLPETYAESLVAAGVWQQLASSLAARVMCAMRHCGSF